VIGVQPTTPGHRKGVIDTAIRAAQAYQMIVVMLPVLVGTLAMLAGQAMNTIDAEVNNHGSDRWDRVLHLMELLL